MLEKILKIILLSTFSLIFLCNFSPLAAQSMSNNCCIEQSQTDILSPAQRQWLNDHPVITLGMEPNFQPLIIQESDGTYTGIFIELIAELNRTLNSNIKIEFGPWVEEVNKARKVEIDGLLTVAPVQIKASNLLSTMVTHYELPMVYVRKDSNLKINSLDDLKGLRLAVQNEIACLHALIVPYDQYSEFYAPDSVLDALKMLTEGKVDAVLAQNYEEYIIAKHLITNIRVAYTDMDNPTPVSIGIRKDWPELVDIINAGLENIGREKITKYYTKWLASFRDLSDIFLTEMENVWLSARPVLKVYLPADQPPYAFLQDEYYRGISMDFLDLISQTLNVKIEPVSDFMLADFVLDLSGSIENSLKYSNHLYEAQQVIITNNNVTYASGPGWLKGKTVAVVKDSFADDYLVLMTNTKRLPASSIKNALQLVADGKADAFMGDVLAASYSIIRYNLPGLKVAGATGISADMLSFSVRTDPQILIPILNKAIQAITDQQHNDIVDKWVSVKYEQVTPWTWVAFLCSMPLALLIFVIFWNRQLNRAVQARTIELRNEKHFTDSAINVLKDMFIVFDPHTGKALRWNESLVKISGYSNDEIRDKPIPGEFFDAENTHIMKGVVQDVLANGHGSCELELNRKDGSKIPVEYTASRLDDDSGELIGLVVVGRDITARRETEHELERHRLHLEELVTERTNELNLRNSELEHTLLQLKQAQGKLILFEKLGALKHLVSGIAHEINSPLGAINASRETIYINHKRIANNLTLLAHWLEGPHADIVRWMISDGYKIKTDGQILSFSDKRKLTAEYIDLLAEADIDHADELGKYLIDLKLYKYVDRLLPMLHEKSSPQLLAVVAAIVESYVACDTVNIAVTKASKIVFALNSYIRKGGSDENGDNQKEFISVKEGIDNILTLFYNSIKYSVDLELDIDDDLPLIFAAPDELNQVWTNLLQNALDAMNRSGKLRIEAHSDNDGISICIADSGSGMTDEVKSRIFEPLFTTKPAGEGTGLGMDIVRKIVVENHEGTINIDSEPNHGTTVTIWLPAKHTAPTP